MAIARKSEFNQIYNDVSDLGKALSHPARCMILSILINENRCVGDVVQRLPLAQSSISQHLKELKRLGLINSEVRERKNFYYINPKRLKELQHALAQILRK